VAFDVLRLNGRSLLNYELASRRQVLDCLVQLSDSALTALATFDGADLDAVLTCCEQMQMEGVVVKRRTSLYRPGRRSADSRKVKFAAWRADHAERRVAVRSPGGHSGQGSLDYGPGVGRRLRWDADRRAASGSVWSNDLA